jgi:hypothetical protein
MDILECYITLNELADRAGLKGTGGLRTQIDRGVLPARKIGRDWWVREEDAAHYLQEHAGKRGRPRKRDESSDRP